MVALSVDMQLKTDVTAHHNKNEEYIHGNCRHI
jgi:hypothetical protein